MKIDEKSVHDAVHDVSKIVEWLEHVRKLDELIDANLAERDRLMSLATKITPNIDGMPHKGGVSDKVSGIAAKLADLAQQTDDLVDMYVDHKATVVAALEKLPANEYGALHRHYIQHMTWEEVAESMQYSTMQIWRFRKSGLEHLKGVIECYTIPMV